MNPVRKTLIAILILLITLPCVIAGTAATRYTGYINKDTYVYKSASKSSKKVKIAVNTKVYVIGTKGKFYQIQNVKNKVKGYVLKTDVSKQKVKVPDPADQTGADEGQSGEEGGSGDDGGDQSGKPAWVSKVVKLEWFKTGKNVMKRGSYGYIYDITTGIRMRIKRMGGTNHADVEPATKADTAKLKKIAGGKFSWNCHAVILEANGQYVACSINTMPHGDQTIKNNGYDGQFCLHMIGSLTHGSKKVNQNHQTCINKAYKWAHG